MVHVCLDLDLVFYLVLVLLYPALRLIWMAAHYIIGLLAIFFTHLLQHGSQYTDL